MRIKIKNCIYEITEIIQAQTNKENKLYINTCTQGIYEVICPSIDICNLLMDQALKNGYLDLSRMDLKIESKFSFDKFLSIVNQIQNMPQSQLNEFLTLYLKNDKTNE